MTEPKIAPYGSWKSPITTDLIVAETIMLGQPGFDGEDIYWLELRPSEGGRMVVVQRQPDGQTADRTPQGFNARTRVHEYGGGSYCVDGGKVYFSNFADQRIYRIDPEGEPVPLTPASDLRYADGCFDRKQDRLLIVREDHTGDDEAINSIVSLDLRGDVDPEMNGGHTLVSGNDFYSNPRLSPDGARLAWLTWSHPNMPWDGTELWVADMRPDGSLEPAQLVAGGRNESIFQPEWSPDGTIYFISDRSGWWNLYRWMDGSVESICPLEAEFGRPQWIFGLSTYGFESPTSLICTYQLSGQSYLARLDTETGKLAIIDIPYSDILSVNVNTGRALVRAASETQPTSLLLVDLDSGESTILRTAFKVSVDPAYFSSPRSITFPTETGFNAYAYHYPPVNPDFSPPPGEKPPLLVMSHGGPTAATSSNLDYEIQYWTSRGFAVLDVNYGGSTGFGRLYRQRLNGNWGVVDVDDCANGALFMAESGFADGNRLAITGGSAGGYTTLCALAFKDVFKAGGCYFGIGDLETFVHDTHKFESRYLDSLVGPYPERKDLYYERSAINYLDQFNCPVIFFQGLEDKIVPPNQSESMFAALKEKGIPTAYLPFEGEQHGFRKAQNIKRALESEFYFYSRVFDFKPADEIEPMHIENL